MKPSVAFAVAASPLFGLILSSCERPSAPSPESAAAAPVASTQGSLPQIGKKLSRDDGEKSVAEALYAMIDQEMLLADNPWDSSGSEVTYSSAIVSGGPGVTTKEGMYLLREIGATAAVIRRTGLSGVEASMSRLDGPSQIARVVAIDVLETALGSNDFLEAMQPMFGAEGRDLSQGEIRALKAKYHERYNRVLRWLQEKTPEE
jgi:hypothetical protein